MSCGNPHDVPCRQVLEAMWLFIDSEPAAIDRDLIIHHLEECPPCMAHSRVEMAFKALLARSLCVQPAPDRVRARVTAQITRIQIQISRVQRPTD